MSRDGLLPEVLSRVHPKYHTPHVITLITGVFVALFGAMFPVGILADISTRARCSPSSWCRSA